MLSNMFHMFIHQTYEVSAEPKQTHLFRISRAFSVVIATAFLNSLQVFNMKGFKRFPAIYELSKMNKIDLTLLQEFRKLLIDETDL